MLGLLGILFLAGCDQPKKPAVKKESVKEASAANPGDSTVADTLNPADCPRAAATPVAKKSIFPDARFALQPDHHTGIETFTLPKGDKITIKQSGCEYYVLNFRMETSRFAADTTDLLYWGDATIQLMREVNKGISTPLEISKGLSKLAARLQAGKNSKNRLKPDEEIDFGGTDPREYLTVNRISQLADQRFLLEITFNYGPI
ncbi:MAG: hypothetical protein EOP42_23085 [Sphingobacteriaceae bacterium]|nr:MAG: hypothetical protein EOP42_23085 [Sphingobacteriaceae bacterium]